MVPRFTTRVEECVKTVKKRAETTLDPAQRQERDQKQGEGRPGPEQDQQQADALARPVKKQTKFSFFVHFSFCNIIHDKKLHWLSLREVIMLTTKVKERKGEKADTFQFIIYWKKEEEDEINGHLLSWARKGWKCQLIQMPSERSSLAEEKAERNIIHLEGVGILWSA